jgi:hypothetical protein
MLPNPPRRFRAPKHRGKQPALASAANLRCATATKPDEKPKKTPTKLWAAFVLN